MEEKIYDRQITKLAVAGRVVDEMQIERHFTDEQIRELYSFKPEPISENPQTPQLPKVCGHPKNKKLFYLNLLVSSFSCKFRVGEMFYAIT